MYRDEQRVLINISRPMFIFAIFLVLKLVGKIDWSWWWVTAPLWGPIALFLALSIIVVVFNTIVIIIEEIIKRWP